MLGLFAKRLIQSAVLLVAHDTLYGFYRYLSFIFRVLPLAASLKA